MNQQAVEVPRKEQFLGMSHGTLECRDIAAARAFRTEFLGLETLRHSAVSFITWRDDRRFYLACVETGEQTGEQGLENRWELSVETDEEVLAAHQEAERQRERWGIRAITAALCSGWLQVVRGAGSRWQLVGSHLTWHRLVRQGVRVRWGVAMKLVSFKKERTFLAGVLLGSVVLDIGRLSEVLDVEEAFPGDIKVLLASGRLDELKRHLDAISGDAAAQEALRRAGIAVDVTEVRLGAPISRPGLIVSSGGAYRDHLEEMDVGSPSDPIGFIKNSAAVCGTDDDIILPRSAPDMVDWEGEFACVIGKTCFAVSPEEALDYLAGYTLINDVSARDGLVEFLTPSGDGASRGIQPGQFHRAGQAVPHILSDGPVHRYQG